MQFNSIEEFVQFARSSTHDQFADYMYVHSAEVIKQLCMQTNMHNFVEMLDANEVPYVDFLEGIVLAQFKGIYITEKKELEDVALIGAIVTELQRFGLQSNALEGLQNIFAMVQQLIAKVQSNEQIAIDLQMPTVIAGD